MSETQKRYTIDDFVQLEWDEYQSAVDAICSGISKYLNESNLSIDFVVPILRGGSPLGISLAHKLNIIQFYPCQYKYSYDKISGEYVAQELLSTIECIQDKNKKYLVLVTEGNHARGGTAKKCIEKINEVLPNAKIIYASIGRDYAHRNRLPHTLFEVCGFLTNETESLSFAQCQTLGVKSKFVVYPWETIEEELDEVNSSLDCN